MPFLKPPSPLARRFCNPSSPSYAASLPAVDNENVVPLAISDLEKSNGEPEDKVIVELKAKVSKLQAQLDTAVASNVTCGPRGPMFGRKTHIRGLEMDLAFKRQEMTRLEHDLQRSETELANALHDNEKLKQDYDSDKSTWEAKMTDLQDEIANLKLNHAEECNDRDANFEKLIADLQGKHENEILTLQDALKAKDEEMKKVSHSFIDNIRSPFQNLHNVKSHQGIANVMTKTTNADSNAVHHDLLSPSFNAPDTTGNKVISDIATAPDSTDKTDSALTTTDHQPANTSKVMVQFDADDKSANFEDSSATAIISKHPLTPMPMPHKKNKRAKTPVSSFFKSAGGSIRRSARKTMKTNRFSPTNNVSI